MFDPGDGLLECSTGRVDAGVVGHHGLDRDRVVVEELLRPVPELRTGRALLVGEDLAVRESAVRVDRGMDEVVTDTVVFHVAAPVDSPTTARWDASELFHVDVDELTGPVGVATPDPLTRRP